MEQPNLSYIHNMSGGDKAFEMKLIEIIKREFPEEQSIYFENLAEKNYDRVAQNVHKLKHKISILGLERSYSLASRYELELLEGKDGLSDDFESILKVITDFLKQV